MKNRERTIEFSKINLTKLAKNNSVGWYFAKGIEGLCLYHGKQKKSFYVQYGTSFIGKDGRINRINRKKKLGDFNEPIEQIKIKLWQQLPKLKEAAKITDGASTDPTVADLVNSFLTDGVKGEKIRSRERKNYKNKTSDGYTRSLKTHILCKGRNTAKYYKELFSQKVRFRGEYVTGSLKDVPLNKVTRKDIEVYMFRMQDKPAAANNAVAALSAAFEWDMSRSHKQLYHGTNNPCLRVKKYAINKDKKFIDIEKVLEIRSYILNNIHKTNTIFTAHFLSFYLTMLEVGERQEDLFGMYWKKPTNIPKAQKAGCTGYLDLDKRLLHIIDSKNRQPATIKLTIEAAACLKKLNEMRYEKLSWCVSSPLVFCQVEDINKPITNNSFRWQRDRFHYRFGLATRKLIRSKKDRKLYKYTNEYTFKHLRKTFVTHYGRAKGLEAARLRMRHSSSEVTKNHYFNEDAAALDVDHMYSPKEERQQHKLAAIKGGKND